MKIKFYLISLLFTLLNCPSAWSASCGGFTMNAASGSTGSISCTSPSETPANIHFKSNDVEENTGKGKDEKKQVLFFNVTDLTGNVHGIFDGAPDVSGFGSFNIDSSVWNSWDSIYVALKQGDSYALFLLTKSIISGTWQTPAQGQGNAQPGTGLSHYIAFGGTQTPNAVPVPAAVWLFGSGLLGLISSAKRKSKN